jgi:hemoglobin
MVGQRPSDEPSAREKSFSKFSKATGHMSNVYEQIGGAAAVDAAVDIFYRKVLRDKRIAGFFDTVDMDAQRNKQKAFLTMAFGGPSTYTGKDMRSAHAHLVRRGLNDCHFDAVVENLRLTLEELKVPESLIAEVKAIAESTRGDVLDR